MNASSDVKTVAEQLADCIPALGGEKIPAPVRARAEELLIDEIAAWASLDDDGKRAVWRQIEARRRDARAS